MNSDMLLDAFGMVDDRFLASEKKAHAAPFRRSMIALIAAVLLLALSLGTAMAVSPEFRELIFSIFHIETPEQPPAGKPNIPPTDNHIDPPQSGLRELDVVDIDGVVHAHYFTSEGVVLTHEGGFYTCAHSKAGAAPKDAAFWEIRTDGIVDVGATRVEFPLTHGNRSFQIIFDYAIVNGKLWIEVWPQNMNEDPIGNGWNIVPIGKRTDVALMFMPVPTGRDYTHDLLLLDLATLETTDLLESIPMDNTIMDAAWITDDLHYAILMGSDMGSDGERISDEYWFCDLERNTITALDALTGTNAAEPYFLNDSTIIFREFLGDGRFHVVSYDIPTGAQNVIVENAARKLDHFGYRGIQYGGGNGAHGLLFREDGSVDLIDLRTRATLNMTGLDTDKLITSESPDGSRVMIAYSEARANGEPGHGFSKLGILNPETGVLQMLTRDFSGSQEDFLGWLDNNTLVITAYDANGGYYVYVYSFREQTS